MSDFSGLAGGAVIAQAETMTPLLLALLPTLIACWVFVSTLRLRGAKAR